MGAHAAEPVLPFCEHRNDGAGVACLGHDIGRRHTVVFEQHPLEVRDPGGVEARHHAPLIGSASLDAPSFKALDQLLRIGEIRRSVVTLDNDDGDDGCDDEYRDREDEPFHRRRILP